MTPASRIRLLVIIACAFTASAESREPLLRVDPPPLGQTQWVAKQMHFNGLPMSVQTFQSTLSVDEVTHHYESWGRTHGLRDFHRSRRGEWRILAMHSKSTYLTVQMRPVIAGAEGIVTVSPPPTMASKVVSEFPRSSTSSIVNLQQYDDGGLDAEHISLASIRSVGMETYAFKNALERAGWQMLRDQPATTIRGGHVIEAQKGAEHAYLTFQPSPMQPGATVIVVIWRKS